MHRDGQAEQAHEAARGGPRRESHLLPLSPPRRGRGRCHVSGRHGAEPHGLDTCHRREAVRDERGNVKGYYAGAAGGPVGGADLQVGMRQELGIQGLLLRSLSPNLAEEG